MALPQYGGPDDIGAVVKYLRTKPTGASLPEARRALEKSVVDARKLSAIESWGFIQRNGDRLALTEVGRDVARDPAVLPEAVKVVIGSVRPYREVLEMAHHRGLSRLDTDEIGAYWHEHFPQDLGTESEKSISAAGATFFKLAEAAGIGRYVLGRKGSPTRIEFDPVPLGRFIEAGPNNPPWSDEDDTRGDLAELSPTDEPPVDEGSSSVLVPNGGDLARDGGSLLRAFISHGKNRELLDQVETILGLAGIESEVAVKEESTAIPVPEKVLTSMRRCTAGIMIVSVDDDQTDRCTVNDNVLIEIGAAFVLYDRRVVLVWDKRIPVPSNLQGLYRCEFEGSELGWNAGMKLMKAIQQFK